MKNPIIRFFASSLIAIPALCSASVPSMTPVDGYPDFAIGADVSWTKYLEDQNYPSYYRTANIDDNNLTNVPLMMADYGIDAVRLRVWVNPDGELVFNGFKAKINNSTWESSPTYGTCNIDEMVEMAARFSRQGLRLMVSFQMSDTWADPGRQYIPAAWSDCTSIAQLREKAVDHVITVLQALKEQNVRLEWVQIGNETSSGMLKYKLPTTSGAAVAEVSFGCGISSSNASTTRNFVTTFEACAKAAKAIYPDCKTVLHIAEGNNWSKVNWTLTSLKKQGFSSEMCDVVGLSLYPCYNKSESDLYNYTAKWQTDADKCLATINNIYTNFGYPTILSEFGMNNEWSNSTPSSVSSTQAGNIAQCDTDVEALTNYLYENLSKESSHCLGVFYWEPETDYMLDYTKGACVSADPGDAWPRDKVRPNNYWAASGKKSTKSTWNLKAFTFDGQSDPSPAPLYIAGDFNDWDYANAVELAYDAELGIYRAEINCESGCGLSISTAKGNTFKEKQIAPASSLQNGVTSIFVNTSNNFAAPYKATWEVVVNTTMRTMSVFTDQKAQATGDDFRKLYLYHWTDKDNFIEMQTSDGIVYHLTDVTAPQWFNFKIVTKDWTFSASGVQVDYDKDVVLGVNAAYNAWTSMAVSASDYWWFNADTNTIRICASSESPWSTDPAPSDATYAVTYDNSKTLWPVVYAYVLDAYGNQLSGTWPGKRLTSDGSDLWKFEIEGAATPSTISFSNGIYRSTTPSAFVDNGNYAYDNLSVEGINADSDEFYSEPVFLNLQGIRIVNPSKGFYIRKTGSKVEKVILK